MFLTIFFSLSLKSQNILTIDIQKLSNNNGNILLELRDDKNNVVKGISKKINKYRCIITIDNLAPGKYSFKYFHDENSNKELDTNWIGIPSEGFGFSNNAMGAFGPPEIEKTMFELKGNITKKCIPKYY